VWLKIDGSKGDLISSIFELFLDESEEVVEFMIPTPKVPTVGTN
jgi:hypothetical protein